VKETTAKEVAFFGRITAGFTHEMKNVLAIIRESAGLLEDLMAVSKSETFPHRERFLQRLSTIQTQVNRGVNLTTRMNRFAHCPDEALSVVDLNELVQQLVLLAERFARLKGVPLHFDPAERAVMIRTSTLKLQLALFLALECCWNGMAAGGALRLRVQRADDEPRVRADCEGGFAGASEFSLKVLDSECWTDVHDAVGELGGQVEADDPGCGFSLILPAGLE